MHRSIQACVIVVPVHDEAALLESCLSSVEAAIAHVRVPCVVRIVLDACSDGSAAIAARHPFGVVHIRANAVGVARASGVAAALASLAEVAEDRVWIANTDADSTVPPHWLVTQLALADSGADVVTGTVRPDFEDVSPGYQLLWLQTHTPGAPAGNTHGANLGVRARDYRAARGFGALVEHEDVRLVEECRRLGATVVVSDAAEVVTSGRVIGRTPGGFAGFIRAQEQLLRLERTG